MPSNPDIYRSAAVMIREHGEAAAAEAQARAESLEAQGESEGAAIWRRILAAVQELQRTERPAGQAQH